MNLLKLGALGAVAATCTLLLPASATAATTVATAPEGYITLNIAAGTGTSSALTTISLPLHKPLQGNGQLTGVVTGVTSTTITNANAGWTAAALSGVTSPYAIKITSGTAVGRVFVVSNATANTADTVTVDNQTTDLTTLGIVVGTDTYEVFPVDTILSLFGTPATTGVKGGADFTQADGVKIYTKTGWRSYFYDSNLQKWTLAAVGTDANNVILRPDQGIMYSRIDATPLALTLLGRVPNTNSKIVINNSGVTYIGSTWPTDTTLATSGIQNTPGWVTGSSFTTADQIKIYTKAKGWKSYYHNGTKWMLAAVDQDSDAVPIAAGSSVIITKLGTTTGVAVLSQSLPYSLN